MLRVRAHVRQGRLVLDEPTDLPEGTEVALVQADAEIVARLRAAPPADDALAAEEVDDLRRLANGPFVPHDEVREKVAARKS